LLLKVSVNYIFILVLSGIYIGLAIGVYYSNRKSWVNRLFTIYMSLIWLYAVLIFFYIGAGVAPWFLIPLQTAVVSYQGIVFYYFSRAFIDDKFHWQKKNFIPFIPAVYLTLYNAARIFVPSMNEAMMSSVRIESGVLHSSPDAHYYIYTVYLIVSYIAGVIVLIRGLRTVADPAERKRIRSILTAIILGITGVFILVNLFKIIGIKGMSEYAVIPAVASLIVIGFSLMRDRAWKIEGLFEAIRERNEIVEAELDTARMMQKKLIPQKMPEIDRFTLAARCKPMDKVGGDFYDYIYKDNTLDLIIADVCGHGIPGAFMASITKAGFRFYGEKSSPLAGMVRNLDSFISGINVKSHFVTTACIRINTSALDISWVNSGHCYSLLHRRSSGGIIELSGKGKPLGLDFNTVYDERKSALLPGDRIIMYTDGIVEAVDNEGNLFGDERFRNYIISKSELTPEHLIEKLFGRLKEFSGTVLPTDDMTVVVVDFNG
jgi:serine phosphatase RsbU (regulator of sigma subunit)